MTIALIVARRTAHPSPSAAQSAGSPSTDVQTAEPPAGAIHTAECEERVSTVVQRLSDRRIGAVPVMKGGAVVGIFSERDLVYGIAREGPGLLDRRVEEVMTAPAVTVSPQTGIDEALALMTRRRIRHLPVVDAGRMVGIVSIGDLVKYRIDLIEAEAQAMRDYIRAV